MKRRPNPCRHCGTVPSDPVRVVRSSNVVEYQVTCICQHCPTRNPQTGTGVRTFGYTAEEALANWNAGPKK